MSEPKFENLDEGKILVIDSTLAEGKHSYKAIQYKNKNDNVGVFRGDLGSGCIAYFRQYARKNGYVLYLQIYSIHGMFLRKI